ncbi:MAG TPA: thiamine biosynthesis protein ThiS [Ruminococcaceae bacterium]|jgi:sulfur carrier protein|nr:thiamine biosynthesis protein ThiS [Oscillospiraceae bacterium]HCM24122.1 thiamine biosynthesis protein ThiS [Oscillospiraceae bacterium]
MKITINGESHTCQAGETLLSFLKAEGISPQTVVAEYNGSIVQMNQFGTTLLHDGDSLELLRFVGGG